MVQKTQAKKPRKLDQPEYKTLRLHKKIKTSKPLIGSFRLMIGNLKHIAKYKRLFIAISLIYFVLSLILVTGLVGGADLSQIKTTLQDALQGSNVEITTGVALFGVLVSGGGTNVSEVGSLYQSILVVIMSLVFIWVFRQTYAKNKISVRDAFYRSTSPLIPFLLVLIVIGLQFLPLLAGTTVYSIVISQGLAVSMAEKFLWLLLLLSLVLLTLYMVSSSLFALYIVTLPEVTPMQALRSARDLVRHRRWSIMRKIIFLPVAVLLLAAMVMIPVLLYITAAAQWIFILLSIFGIIIAHGYIYRLYRELL